MLEIEFEPIMAGKIHLQPGIKEVLHEERPDGKIEAFVAIARLMQRRSSLFYTTAPFAAKTRDKEMTDLMHAKR